MQSASPSAASIRTWPKSGKCTTIGSRQTRRASSSDSPERGCAWRRASTCTGSSILVSAQIVGGAVLIWRLISQNGPLSGAPSFDSTEMSNVRSSTGENAKATLSDSAARPASHADCASQSAGTAGRDGARPSGLSAGRGGRNSGGFFATRSIAGTRAPCEGLRRL